MTRSRARRNNGTRKESSMVLFRTLKDVSVTRYIVRSCSHANMNNAGSHFAGNETYIHPQYGFYGGIAGSVDAAYINGVLVNINASYGIYANYTVIKARYRFTCRNLDAFSTRVVWGPISSSLNGKLGLNYNGRLDDTTGYKVLDLNKAGVTGDFKTIEITYDCPLINGYSLDQYLGIPGYYGAANAIGTLFTKYYTQIFSDDLTTNFVNGVQVLCNGEFEVQALQQNVTLDA